MKPEEVRELQGVLERHIDALHARMPQFPRAKAAQWWRLNNLYWIEDVNGKKVKFRATPLQTAFFFDVHVLTDVLKARQAFISTICALMTLDNALSNANWTCGIVDKTDDDAKRKLDRIRFAYQHLDDPDDQATAAIGLMFKMVVPVLLNNAHEMAWANESKIWAGNNLRGGTINFLWVSEFGYTAANDPERAREITAGAFNTVHVGNTIVVESTHEGGRYGLNYELIRRAMGSPKPPGLMDWKFLFYAWHEQAIYTLEPPAGGFLLTAKLIEYFERIERTYHKKLTPGQKYWYLQKSRTPGVDMARQFPGTSEEALSAAAEGAIFGDEMVELRAKGRICELVPDSSAPLLTCWDIGQTDYTSVWLLQFIGFDIHALRYHCGHNMKPAQHVAAVLGWEREFRRPIMRNFLPHDGSSKQAGGETYIDQVTAAGLLNVVRVPRVPKIWDGINQLRDLLPRFRFDVSCDQDITREEMRYPSGVGCLEAYRCKVVAVGGAVTKEPIHDEASHGVSALRTIAEAHARKMLVNVPAIAGEQRRDMHAGGRALMGIREPHTVKANQREMRGVMRPVIR